MESMSERSRWASAMVRLACVLLLAACGGPAAPARTAGDVGDEEDEDEQIDEEPELEENEREGFVDAAMLRESSAPIALGEPIVLAGTGVTIRPPEGAEALPFGAGFISMRDRVQISVVVVVGPESLIEAVRTGGQPNGPEALDVEETTVSGADGRTGRDRVRIPNGELERGWLLAHDGTRGLAVMGTYEASRSNVAWAMMQECFGSIEWDRTAVLDAAQALGIEVARVEGLTPSPSTTANVVLLGRGASFPPEAGQPVVTISPLPMQLASENAASICAQLVARLLPAEAARVEQEGTIEGGPLPGCERLATADTEDGPIATYAAVLFSGSTPILVTGSVEAGQMRRWRARFASAARAVRPRS
jgi:hypothetical protein